MTLPTFTMNRFERVVTDERFTQKNIILYRPIFGVEEYGVRETTFENPLQLRCLVQPASSDDLELLPEGTRLNNVIAVWSTIPLYVGNGKDHDSDVLEVDGVKFTVQKMFDRSANGYHKVLAEGYITESGD